MFSDVSHFTLVKEPKKTCHLSTYKFLSLPRIALHVTSRNGCIATRSRGETPFKNNSVDELFIAIPDCFFFLLTSVFRLHFDRYECYTLALGTSENTPKKKASMSAPRDSNQLFLAA